MAKTELAPCPFCGLVRNLEIEITLRGKRVNWQGDHAKLTCTGCCVTMEADQQEERFERVEGDLYRLIPHKYAEKVLTEKWNRRADAALGGDGDG